MKEKFKRNKKNTSGESPASTESDELEEVFDTFPDSDPKCIIESGTKNEPVSLSSGFKGKEMKRPISPASSDNCNLEEPGSLVRLLYMFVMFLAHLSTTCSRGAFRIVMLPSSTISLTLYQTKKNLD